MSGAMSATTIAMIGAGVAGGMMLSSAMSQKAPQIQPPAKPPQPSKAPERNAMAGANLAAALPGGAMAGNSSTFLTGATGIDPATLNLGKNTLLGQ